MIKSIARYSFISIFSFLSISSFAQETDEPIFYLEFIESDNKESQRILDVILEDEELFYEVVDELNDYLDMPVAVPIVFQDCGEANAFYDPQEGRVIMCYEYALDAEKIFKDQKMSTEEVSLAVANETFATLYHEIGHALVHLLELPITGSEESAVDQFSIVSLLVFDELGKDALLHSARFWQKKAQMYGENYDMYQFSGVHPMDAQRFYNLLCLAYASDPQNLSFLVEEGILPESRAGGCEDELERVEYAWNTLLEPYTREE